MPKIELTKAQATELQDVLLLAMDSITEKHTIFDPSDADDIAAKYRLSVLEDILQLVENA